MVYKIVRVKYSLGTNVHTYEYVGEEIDEKIAQEKVKKLQEEDRCSEFFIERHRFG